MTPLKDLEQIKMRVQENLDLTEISDEFEMSEHWQQRLADSVTNIVECELEETNVKSAALLALVKEAREALDLSNKWLEKIAYQTIGSEFSNIYFEHGRSKNESLLSKIDKTLNE